jgi:serine/threonine protein kinase HipA of HipAB toxin-antitoxin module
MSNEWLDKAKQAAMSVAESAKNAAQNANLGEMLDKTKNMAMQAADEAKRAAGSVMSKTGSESADKITGTKEEMLQACNDRVGKIEKMLQEVKEQLAKLQ